MGLMGWPHGYQWDGISPELCAHQKKWDGVPPFFSAVLEFHTVSLSPSGAAKAGRGTRTKALHDYLDNFDEGGGVCARQKIHENRRCDSSANLSPEFRSI